MPTTIKPAKTKPRIQVSASQAKLNKRESDLLSELCAHHGYSFADDCPSGKKTTMMYSHDKVTKKTKITLGICVRLMVPGEGALGMQVIEQRAAGPKKNGKGKPG